MTPLLSVCVPTHNRARYALHAILSLLRIPASELEIVVTDTSTDGELLSALTQHPEHPLQDSRLNYVRPRERLDMTGNHNAAVELARGRYVCLIGDDDTISAEALEATKWAHSRGHEALAPKVIANYVWPDFRSRYFGKTHAGRLYVAKSLGDIRVRESHEALDLSLRYAAQGTDGMPKVYHGIVEREVLARMKARSGAYFHGSSPDVSGSIGVALTTSRFVEIDYPLTIPGASAGSNTGRSAMNTHKGKLSGEAQTQAFLKSGWSVGVPRFFSVETVWAHAAIETLVRFDDSLIRRFNFARLLAACLLLHPEFKSEISAASQEVCALLSWQPNELSQRIQAEARALRWSRLRHVLLRATRPTAAGGRDYRGGLSDVGRAQVELNHYLAERRIRWAEFVDRQSSPMPAT